jgi:hypothetical protein
MEIIYTGVKLDEESQDWALGYAYPFRHILGTYLITAHGKYVTDYHKDLVGTKVTLTVKNIVMNDFLKCLEVEPNETLRCVDKYPNITLSIDPRRSQLEANAVIESYYKNPSSASVFPVTKTLRGTCGIVFRGDRPRGTVCEEGKGLWMFINREPKCKDNLIISSSSL